MQAAMERYDLIAIGGGTAGLVAAAGGAALGLRVALVERDALGGDCLWTGCVPSKALIASARLAQRMRHAAELGLVGSSPAHAFGTVIERVRQARATVSRHDDPDRFRALGVEVVFGPAEMRAPDVVDVGGRRLAAKRIVIATGAEPAVPPIPGLDDVPYVTHATAFEQDTLPPSLVMLGAGPIGLELAHAYRRLGADVTVIEVLPQVLPQEDADVAAVVRGALQDDGVVIHTGARVEHVERGRDGRASVTARAADGGVIAVACDSVFVATGRRPRGEGMGLAAIGVELVGGAVRVDRSLRSSVRTVWAAGDVCGGPQFTHVAEYQAKLVLRNAVFPFSSKTDYTAVPAVTYTDPEVARVGLTEHEARERHADVSVYRYAFADLDRAIVDGNTTGFVKAITRRGGRLIGATIVGTGAGDLLVPFVLAIRRKIPLPKLSQIVYPYPTMSEGIKRTADAYYRAKLTGRAGQWLRRIVRWLA
jgi:pyruvate/2-oxoglutarate dehydrogenase complex dihydrolipoamide dehydrogenase (E3) component